MVPKTDERRVPIFENDDDDNDADVGEYVDSFEWKVKWDHILQLPSGICFKSSVIKTRAYKWQLELFPNGLTPLQKGFLSVYLNSQNIPSVQASCCFSICNKSNEKFVLKDFPPYLFSTQGMSWGFPEYVSREVAQRFLTKGHLKIHCEVKVKPIDSTVTLLDGSVECLRRVQDLDRYENLLDNLMYSDLAFNVQGTLIYAHKVILAGKSQVFADILKDIHIEMIEVHDFSYEVFMEVLRFVYAAKVNAIKSLAEPLLKAAMRYKLQKLIRMCEETIFEEVNLDNAFFYLDIAYEYRASYLKKCIFKLLRGNMEEVAWKPEYKHFIRMHSHFLEELSRWTFNEMKIFKMEQYFLFVNMFVLRLKIFTYDQSIFKMI